MCCHSLGNYNLIQSTETAQGNTYDTKTNWIFLNDKTYVLENSIVSQKKGETSLTWRYNKIFIRISSSWFTRIYYNHFKGILLTFLLHNSGLFSITKFEKHNLIVELPVMSEMWKRNLDRATYMGRTPCEDQIMQPQAKELLEDRRKAWKRSFQLSLPTSWSRISRFQDYGTFNFCHLRYSVCSSFLTAALPNWYTILITSRGSTTIINLCF